MLALVHRGKNEPELQEKVVIAQHTTGHHSTLVLYYMATHIEFGHRIPATTGT